MRTACARVVGAAVLRTIRSPRARRERNKEERIGAELVEGERESLLLCAFLQPVSLSPCMYAPESHPLCNELKLVKNQRRVCVVPQSGDDGVFSRRRDATSGFRCPQPFIFTTHEFHSKSSGPREGIGQPYRWNSLEFCSIS